MNIPTYVYDRPVQDDLYFTRTWQLLFENLLQNMQGALGPMGFAITTVSSDPNSVSPPTAGGQLEKVRATFGQQNGIIAGTVVYDPFEAPNGSLKVVIERWNVS